MDAKDFARLMQERHTDIDRRLRADAERLKADAQAKSRALLEKEIYARPEDVSSTGRKKWERTRKLIESEKAVIDAPYSVRLVNDQPYALPRHELGRGPSGRKTDRIAHWRDDLLNEMREDVTQKRRLAMLQALKWGRNG